MKCVRRPPRNWPRAFTAHAIGKLVCGYVNRSDDRIGRNGRASKWPDRAPELSRREQLRRAIDQCLPCQDDEAEQERAEAEQAVEAQVELTLVDQLKANRGTIAIAIGALIALGLVGRFAIGLLGIAGSAAVPVAVRVAITQIPGVIQKLQTAAAANEAVIKSIQLLKRAA